MHSSLCDDLLVLQSISCQLELKSLMINHAGSVNVPQQLVVKKDASSIPLKVAKARLNLPLGMLTHLMLSCMIMLICVGEVLSSEGQNRKNFTVVPYI